jgi:hypothetical protein
VVGDAVEHRVTGLALVLQPPGDPCVHRGPPVLGHRAVRDLAHHLGAELPPVALDVEEVLGVQPDQGAGHRVVAAPDLAVHDRQPLDPAP